VLTHQAEVRYSLDGRDLGTFRTSDGGGKTSDAQLVRPGGMAPPRAFPGPYSYAEVTANRLLIHGVDSGLVQFCKDHVGWRIKGTIQPLDERGNAGFHQAENVEGVLAGVTTNGYDAAGTDAKVLELTILPDSES
jgi:hypothetical protein